MLRKVPLTGALSDDDDTDAGAALNGAEEVDEELAKEVLKRTGVL